VSRTSSRLRHHHSDVNYYVIVVNLLNSLFGLRWEQKTIPEFSLDTRKAVYSCYDAFLQMFYKDHTSREWDVHTEQVISSGNASGLYSGGDRFEPRCGIKYLHRSPASPRRRRKGKPMPGSITDHPVPHSWSRALLENLPIVQLLENFPAFYGTRRFITAFT
jgi:hypothetical protein